MTGERRQINPQAPGDFSQSCKDLVAWIRKRKHLLLATHTRPDGDAIGSLVGMWHILTSMGISASLYVQESVPDAYTSILPSELIIGGPLEIEKYDGLICLDSATTGRIALPSNISFADIKLPIANIDHHLDNPHYGEIQLVPDDMAATAEVLTHFCLNEDISMTRPCATALLMGVITDTGGFRHNNTNARVLRTSATLLDHGADYDNIIRDIFYSESQALVNLRTTIFENLKSAHDNRLVYFWITPELLEEHGVDDKDTEDLIDAFRVIKGVDLICRMQTGPDHIRFSLRSQNKAFPVIDIAHKLNGGGHAMAAGAKMYGITPEEAEKLLLTYTGELFNG